MGRIIRPRFGGRAQGKPLVVIAVPSHRKTVPVAFRSMDFHAGFLSKDRAHPFSYFPLSVGAHYPIHYARNLCVEAFLSLPGAAWLYFIDDDMVPPENWNALLKYGEPMVSGFSLGWQEYHKRERRPPSPLFVSYWKQADGAWKSGPPVSYTEPYRCDGVGAACLLIHRSVLERVGKPWFKTVFDETDGHVITGEDLWFFDRARAEGMGGVLVDPTVIFGHEKTLDVMDVGRYGLMSREDGKRERQVQVAD